MVPRNQRSQPKAQQVPPVQNDRLQGPARMRAPSGSIPDTLNVWQSYTHSPKSNSAKAERDEPRTQAISAPTGKTTHQ